MASLSLRHIYKVYQGGVKAVSDFNLEIADKEFIVFVGPSGCGKSTTLRMIAGLEEITDGELYIDGRLVNTVEPKDRDIAMVFQSYALYPHMTVYQNMAFSLKLRKVPSDEIDRKVKEAANILGITQLLTRKPKALSGGQRQRVALGRAIVREPKVFLLDEPLSNLDAKLRVQMRTEITKIHHKLATTFIYVTHDQIEAMTMGTRIVVMKDGIMQQVDSPQNLYDAPCNLFVASFIGTPQMNFFKSTLSREGENLFVSFGKNKIKLPVSKSKQLHDESYIGKEVILGIRPEDIHDEEIFINSAADSVLEAEVEVMEKLGNETQLFCKVDGKEDSCVARVDARTTVKLGDVITLGVDAHHVHLFDPQTELSILGVPKYNYFDSILANENNELMVTVGGQKFGLGENSYGTLADRTQINNNVKVGISPDHVEISKDGSKGIPAVVDFIEETNAYFIIFMKMEGRNGFVVAKEPLNSEIKPGDKVGMVFENGELGIFNEKTLERLTTFATVPEYNEVPATYRRVNDTTKVSFLGTSAVLPKALDAKYGDSGECKVAIAPASTVYAKEMLVNKATAKAYIVATDVIGEQTLVFTKIGDQEVVFSFDNEFPAKPGDKIKVGFVTEDIILKDKDGNNMF